MGKKPYNRNAPPLEPIVFDVETWKGTVTITAEHKEWGDLWGFRAAMIGDLPVSKNAVTAKARMIEERRRLMAFVTTSVDTGDPNDPDVRACAGDWNKFYRLEGNDELVYLAWNGYEAAIDAAVSKSSAEDSGRGDGDSDDAAEPGSRPDPLMRAV